MGGERAQGGGSERSKRSPGRGGPARVLPRLCRGAAGAGERYFYTHLPKSAPCQNGPAKPWGPVLRFSMHESPPAGTNPAGGGLPSSPTTPSRDVGAPRAHRSPPLLSAGLLGLPQPGVWIRGRRRPRRGAVRWEPGGVFWGALLPRVSLWGGRWLWGSIVLVLTEHEVFMNTLCPHPTSPCGAVS